MSDDNDMDEVLEKFDETQEVSQEFSSYQQEIKKAKQELAQTVAELEREEQISTTKAEEVSRQIQNANYGKARQLMKEALEKQGLDFDAEEKNLFAQKFTDSYEQLQEDTERIRNTLLQLNQGIQRDDLVDILSAKNYQMNKTDIRQVLEALDKIEKNKLSVKDQARVLAAFDYELSVTTTVEILREIKNEADL